MGIFTWTFADDNRKKLQYGKCGYIALPNNTFIKEPSYQGYGMFGSHDAYDIVTDLNKQYLPEIFDRLDKTYNHKYFGNYLKELAIAYSNNQDINPILNRIVHEHGSYLKTDWKRNIGITISCGYENNKSLPFPLKITSSDRLKKSYADLPASKSTQ